MRSCSACGLTRISRNGKQRGKQNYLYQGCQRQFIETYAPPSDYDNEFKRKCLKRYGNGMGFRGIERVEGVHHTTVLTWVKQIGASFVVRNRRLERAVKSLWIWQVSKSAQVRYWHHPIKNGYLKGIRSCCRGVPVIWAMQVLESLVKNGAPSRGEMTDAAMSERLNVLNASC